MIKYFPKGLSIDEVYKRHLSALEKDGEYKRLFELNERHIIMDSFKKDITQTNPHYANHRYFSDMIIYRIVSFFSDFYHKSKKRYFKP